MAQIVKLLNHQARFVQAPFVYSDKRFFILCGGYACGKTSSLVYSTMNIIKNLLGKKDAEGHNPKILVCSKNITFLAKTWTNAFEQNLKNTGSEYSFDRAKNIITVGNVEILLVGLEDPTAIYGYSCFVGDTKITTDKGDVCIKDIKAGDLVLTTKGLRKVTRVLNQGIRDCIKVNVAGNKIICTPDHKFIDCFDNEIEAKDLTKTTSLVKLDTKRWNKWQNIIGLIEKNQKLLISMVSDITDTQKAVLKEKDVTSLVVMRIKKEVIRLYTEICGLLNTEQFQQDMMYTIKTETILTTLWKTLSLLQELTMQKNIGKCNQKKNENKLLKHLKKLNRKVNLYGKMQNIEKEEVLKLDRTVNKDKLNVSVKSVEENMLHTLKTLNTVLQNVKEKKQENLTERDFIRAKKQESVLSVIKNFKLTNTALLKPARLDAKTSSVVGQYEVFDIEVEDVHEFFANGIRVHNCVCAIVDELDELSTEVAMEAVKSVNDRIRQQVEGFRTPFICFATTSQGLKGLYQTVMHFKKSGIGYVLMRARTQDNTFLPADYVKNLYAIYNEKERKCLLEGEFISIDSGLVFPDYDKDKNLLDVDLYDCLEENDKVYIGQDFNGFGNNAVAFVVKKGCIIAIKDYEFPDIRRAPEVFRYDFPTQEIIWIPDMTYKEHFSEFKKELRAFNIKIAYRKCNPLVADRNFACNKLFACERLFITPICKDTEKTLMTWQKDPRTGQPTKGSKGAPDHKGDCLGYVVHYLLSWCRELKPLYDVTLKRIYDKRRARGAEAVELEVASTIINASRLKNVSFNEAPNVDK